MDQKKTINVKEDEYIIKNKEEFFPINKEIDKEISKFLGEINWKILLFPFNTPNLGNLCFHMINSSESKEFFQGMTYEYGIKGKKKNLAKAYEIYQRSANSTKSYDSLSMYRMHLIHFCEYNKFSIKRDRNLEKYYLFKAFAFAHFYYIRDWSFMLNKLNIIGEIEKHFSLEDKDRIKTMKMLDYLERNSYYKFITCTDILLIKTAIKYKSSLETNIEINIVKMNEKFLFVNNEISYKIACMIMFENKELAKTLFEFCEKNNYYRSYTDYGYFLFSIKKNKSKALDILKEGAYLGNNPYCIFFFYDAFLHLNHLDLFEHPQENKNYIFMLIELLLKDIVIGSYFSFFEFLFWRKLCIKHFGMKNEFENRYDVITSELCHFLKNIIVDKDFLSQKTICEVEYHLVCGYLYLIGIEPSIEKDTKKALELLKMALTKTNQKSYKRFIYSFIYIARKKLFEQGEIAKEKLIKTEKKLYYLYNSSLEDGDIKDFSASFYYYLAKLSNKGIGNKPDDIKTYFYYNEASIQKTFSLGSGSVISYYRHYKSMSKVSDEKKKEVLKDIELLTVNTDNEGYGEDGSFCPICFTNKRNIVIIPCKHLICNGCLNQIVEGKNKCPICRGMIFFSKELSFK